MGKNSKYSPSVGLGVQMSGTPWMLIGSSSLDPLVSATCEACCESARISGKVVLGSDLRSNRGSLLELVGLGRHRVAKSKKTFF